MRPLLASDEYAEQIERDSDGEPAEARIRHLIRIPISKRGYRPVPLVEERGDILFRFARLGSPVGKQGGTRIFP